MRAGDYYFSYGAFFELCRRPEGRGLQNFLERKNSLLRRFYKSCHTGILSESHVRLWNNSSADISLTGSASVLPYTSVISVFGKAFKNIQSHSEKQELPPVNTFSIENKEIFFSMTYSPNFKIKNGEAVILCDFIFWICSQFFSVKLSGLWCFPVGNYWSATCAEVIIARQAERAYQVAALCWIVSSSALNCWNKKPWLLSAALGFRCFLCESDQCTVFFITFSSQFCFRINFSTQFQFHRIFLITLEIIPIILILKVRWILYNLRHGNKFPFVLCSPTHPENCNCSNFK